MKVTLITILSLITVLSVVAVVKCGHNFEKVNSNRDLQFVDDKIAGMEANKEVSNLLNLFKSGVCALSRLRLDEYDIERNGFFLLDIIEKYARAFIHCVDQIESNLIVEPTQ